MPMTPDILRDLLAWRGRHDIGDEAFGELMVIVTGNPEPFSEPTVDQGIEGCLLDSTTWCAMPEASLQLLPTASWFHDVPSMWSLSDAALAPLDACYDDAVPPIPAELSALGACHDCPVTPVITELPAHMSLVPYGSTRKSQWPSVASGPDFRTERERRGTSNKCIKCRLLKVKASTPRITRVELFSHRLLLATSASTTVMRYA